MKYNKHYITKKCTAFILIFTISVALYKSYLAISNGDLVYKSSIWTIPIVSTAVYFIYSFFIRNPEFLVKKIYPGMKTLI